MGKEYSLQGRNAPGYKTWAPKKGHPAAPAETALPSAGAVGGPKGAAGLSKPHIKTGEPYQSPKPKPSLTWYPGASLVEVHVPREHPKMPAKDRKPRGRITEMSADARRRLKLFMGTLQREELSRALVVTLTYPADFPAPDDHEVYKYHLNKFGIYLTRRWPKCSAVWKLEFQKRGAAHYHLMLFGLHKAGLEIVRAWVRETWYKIAHKGDKFLGIAGTQVDIIKSVGGAVSYLVKYLSKGDQTMPGNFGGKYWGKINKECLPVVNPETVELEEKKAVQIRRMARKKMKVDTEKCRWKRWEEWMRKRNWCVTRLQWETAKMQYQGGAKRVGLWTLVPKNTIREFGEVWVAPAFLLRMRYDRDHFLYLFADHTTPQRWKPYQNDRVRVMCDAEAFVDAVSRLDNPASSFLKFSRESS